jgi:molybdopterin biosynthesis enzyme
MINVVEIIPTGDELRNGIVLDTDSPMLMQKLLELNNNCIVRRRAVTQDTTEAISDQIRQCLQENPDLIILIGGSGSGHLHSEISGKDCTYSSMETQLNDVCATSLYGKNGHMWSRLVCGYVDETMVINVPGPYAEAKAAIEAFCSSIKCDYDLKEINRAMAEAVKKCYESFDNGHRNR